MRGRNYTRQKVKQTFGNLHKGSLIGVTHNHTSKAGREKFRMERTYVGFGEQFIEEKILMLNRHSCTTVKLIKSEIALNQQKLNPAKTERLYDMLKKTKA